MPIGTAVHDRTSKLCESMNYREWSGYYAVSVYEMHHEHEYNAIRNACALIDVSPLYKYRISGQRCDEVREPRDHARHQQSDNRPGDLLLLVRRARKSDRRRHDFAAGRKCYRWTAADPSIRWFHQNALGPGREDRRHFDASGGAGAAGADFRALAEEGGAKRTSRT